MAASLWSCSNAEYHADRTKIGSTMLKTALKSPARYKRLYLDDPPLAPATSPAFALGQAVHCLVLEPQKFDSMFACRPEGIDGRTTDGKKRLAEFRLSALGKTELAIDVLVQARAMAASVLSVAGFHETMLAPGAMPEQTVVWDTDGMAFKARFDLVVHRPERNSDLIVDLKTSDDPTPEHWDSGSWFGPVRKYGYDLQAAHYCLGHAALNDRPAEFWCVVVGKEEPHDVYIYNMGLWLRSGREARDLAITIIKNGNELQWRRPQQHELYELGGPNVQAQ
jgi:hypothetical protein